MSTHQPLPCIQLIALGMVWILITPWPSDGDFICIGTNFNGSLKMITRLFNNHDNVYLWKQSWSLEIVRSVSGKVGIWHVSDRGDTTWTWNVPRRYLAVSLIHNIAEHTMHTIVWPNYNVYSYSLFDDDNERYKYNHNYLPRNESADHPRHIALNKKNS